MKRRKAPTLKKPLPMMGRIQGREAREVQPNQKRQIGMQKAPTKAGGRRFWWGAAFC